MLITMALADLTSREAVDAALDEFDRLGREAFLARYDFGRARRYFIQRSGALYDSKAIVGAALGYQYPDRGPLPSSEFSGGEHGAKARLEALGFEVVARPSLAAADTLPLRDALEAALAAQAARDPHEWSDDLQKAVAVTLANAVRGVVGQDFRVKGSAGFGNQAEIPWLSVMPPGLKGASEGRYVVYLFAADGTRVFLSLSQAVTGRPKSALRGLAEEFRQTVGDQPDLLRTIDLGGQGGLGARYELATAYAKRYEADALPSQGDLEADLGRFLRMLDEGESPVTHSADTWIFQASPAYYDIDRALRTLPEIEWTVRQYRKRVQKGDRAYIWRSGQLGGIVAVGTVGTEPAEKAPDAAEDEFYLRREDFSKVEPRVKIVVERVLDEPLLRTALQDDPVLKSLGILRFANATVHEVDANQERRLRELLGDAPTDERDPFNVDAIVKAATKPPRRLLLDESIYASVFAALESGKHVILTGPPGTAKTTLAEAVAEAASAAGMCNGHVLTTATADWTTYETIGGLRPERNGALGFAPGHFLEAIEQNRWLVIDELNRSNFDRAFGQLFTVLSGQAVQLPYARKEGAGRIALVPPDAPTPAGSDPIHIPQSWRIIATMNVFDKSLLFEMSFALMRRFAFVEVASPSLSVFDQLIESAADGSETAATLTRQFLPLRKIKDLGPAVFMDMARYLRARDRLGGTPRTQLAFEAFYSYLLPQFEGIDDPTGESLYRRVLQLVGRDNDQRLRETLRSVLGVELSSTVEPEDSELDTELETFDLSDVGEPELL